jgi:beta-glucanase (GH16 family)
MNKLHSLLVFGLVVTKTLLAASTWDLVWSDEFDKPGSPDTTKWRIQVGASTVNNEAEYYSNRIENLKVADGNLYIIARKENFGGRNYTSGRMDTETKAFWTFGRFEIKAKLPPGKGSWPAFWMLGHDCDKHGGWPDCGEIDIAEYAGKNPNVVNSTLHMRDINYRLKNNPHGSATLEDVGNVFHIYAVEWFKDHMDFFYDSTKILTFKDAGKGTGSWPYFNPQYIIINEALGGGYGGPIDDKIFPTQWVIDYVRVYKAGSPTQILHQINPKNISTRLGFFENKLVYKINGRKIVLPYLLSR